MGRPTRLATIGALVALAATPAAANGAAQHLTPEAARHKVTLHQDPLETEAVLSTKSVLRSTRGVLKTTYNDNHLRANIDRQTGKTRFEVHQTVQYMGGFRGFEQVNYETSSAPATAKLRTVDANPAACDAIDPQSGCYEELSFVVDEAELRRVASSSAAGEAWSFKFKPERGREHRDSLPKAEIAGLLQAVDAYRATATSKLAMADATIAP